MELEYRAAFWAQVLSMLLNDAMWLCFWVLYFERFPVVKGWERQDVVCLWAIVATGYGVAHGLAGNAANLARIIYRGELDVYLAQPQPVLLHVLVSRTRASAWGDVLFGTVVFAWLGGPTSLRCGLYVVAALLAGTLLCSFLVLVQSLAFFLGNAELLAEQLYGALIHFSTYPTGIFAGPVKLILFSVLPAGFINYLPVGLLRNFSWPFALAALAAAAGFGLGAVRVFAAGLRRYESGNLVMTRL